MYQQVAPNSAGALPRARSSSSQGQAAVTFLLCAVLFTVTLATVSMVVGIAQIARPGLHGLLAAMLLNVLVLFLGFLAIARARVPELRALSAIGLVRRPSAGREAGLGLASGWAIGLALVVPGLLLLRMHSTISMDGFHLGAVAESILVLLLFVLGRQMVLCGLPFRSLSEATSPMFASVAFAGVAALLTAVSARGNGRVAWFAAIAQLVFCMAAVRTRAIWLGAALQFAWGLTITLLFGLSSVLWPPAAGIIQGSIAGPRWLTGGRLGPEAALWAYLVLLAAFGVVWRLTRDYAWHHTFDPIEAAGYPMDVAPPAEHVRMEQAAQAPPLVQIGGIPPAAADSLLAESEPPQKL